MLTSPSLQAPSWLGHYVAVAPDAVLAPVRLSGSMTNVFPRQELPAGWISETSEVATKIRPLESMRQAKLLVEKVRVEQSGFSCRAVLLPRFK